MTGKHTRKELTMMIWHFKIWYFMPILLNRQINQRRKNTSEEKELSRVLEFLNEIEDLWRLKYIDYIPGNYK